MKPKKNKFKANHPWRTKLATDFRLADKYIDSHTSITENINLELKSIDHVKQIEKIYGKVISNEALQLAAHGRGLKIIPIDD
jgi:hypothetical protein